MKLSNFNYNLPKNAIAKEPHIPRDEAKLMVLDRATNTIEHFAFKDVINYISKGKVVGVVLEKDNAIADLRKLNGSTNPVEAVHRVMRKVTKSKGGWSNEKGLIKQLYLTLMYNKKSWNKLRGE